VHIRIPIHESPIVRCAEFCLRGLKNSQFKTSATYSTSAGTESLPVSVPSTNVFAIDFSGGIRYYVNRRFGFRVEANAYKPESLPGIRQS